MPDETTTTLYLDKQEFTIAMTFTVYPKQVGELSDLQQREQRKRSPIVQDSVDLYYLASHDDKLQELRNITELSSLELIQQAIKLLYQNVKNNIEA